jgi:hypothetical protein
MIQILKKNREVRTAHEIQSHLLKIIKAQGEFFERLQIVTHREMYDTAELLEYGGLFKKGTVVSEAGKLSLFITRTRVVDTAMDCMYFVLEG